ncbi:PKD domain-containing protein [Luteitalea sp. TBR-22]|uniref:PKD domain-containing protein n=1 Tax=Luteitalea sp. TBR-22 TaxID=2802971 RepID=UPI001EF60899|nr:PKD domain-containing protein [Luteitalea sp. TBR-22]
MLAPRHAGRPMALRVLLGMVPLSVALVAGACNKAPLTAPTDSAVTLFAAQTVVALNGTVEITANVTEPGGVPVQNGTQVNFTTTLGTIDPAEARTSGGKATVRLNAGAASGIAQVRAFSGGAQAEAIEIRVGAAAASQLTLTASPSAVGANGGTVDLVAVATGENNQRLPGVPVTFGTNAGSLRDATVITDGNGEARTQLTTTREATVTATVGTVQATTTVRVTTRPIITLTGPSTAVGEGETTTFTVNVQPQTNGDPVRDVVIDFGDGERRSLGALTGSRTVQKVYARKGTYQVTVSVLDTGGETTAAVTTVTVEERAISVTLTASPSTAAANTVVQFTATASGTNIVAYNWNLGDGDTRVTTGPTTSKVYGTAGRRRVSVEVVNAAGQRGTATIEILIQ